MIAIKKARQRHAFFVIHQLKPMLSGFRLRQIYGAALPCAAVVALIRHLLHLLYLSFCYGLIICFTQENIHKEKFHKEKFLKNLALQSAALMRYDI